jgi:hypothetical protein
MFKWTDFIREGYITEKWICYKEADFLKAVWCKRKNRTIKPEIIKGYNQSFLTRKLIKCNNITKSHE